MNILYIASEAAPFIKTGGLADVAGSLPKEFNKMGHDCRVVIPLYGQISEEYRKDMKKIAEFWVDFNYMHKYCGVLELERDGTIYYFLDNEAYFKRATVYGEWDDAERFIFFSRAATMLPKVIGFVPNIIHSNDWHTALVNVYVNDFRNGDSFYDPVRTVFTIHNLKYQGIFGLETFRWTGLPMHYAGDYDLKLYDTINFMKGGIIHANAVTTVSQTYAQEIQYPFFGEGLDSIIRAYSYKLHGIVNGIDYDVWNPATDEYIEHNYDIKTLEVRKENKKALQERYGLPVRDVPMIALISRLTAMKGLDLVRYIMEQLLQDDIQVVILGTGDFTYEEMFSYFAWKYPEKCAARIYYNGPESHMIYSATDLFLMPSIAEPCGISQLISMRYGALPIVRETGGLGDTVIPYNEYTKEGTGFSFANINAHELLDTIYRALDVYRNRPEDFVQLQKNAMRAKHDWEESSKKYLELYESL